MKKTVKLLFILFLVAFFRTTSVQETTDNYSSNVVVDNLDTPWSLDFLPDNSIIFTERPGNIKIFIGDTSKTILHLPIVEISESGLLGVAVDPDFIINKYVYLYYTFPKEGKTINRVSRFIFADGLKDEQVLLDDIPFARYHDGGRIKFGPDDKLYITTGDALEPGSAQNINSLAGKILRMNKDGTIPQDNPFENYVYSYGHRNSQGIAWLQDKLFASEHGPTRHDEINRIVKGGNYGWPATCEEQKEDTKKPLRCYLDFTLAPSGIAFYKNKLYVACLRGTQLREITLTDDHKIEKERVILDDMGRIRTVVKKNNSLFIATNNRDGRGNPRSNDDKIIKIVFDEDAR
ncbi:MAG: PQQ-dependent sugar dehydrogenase [Candidatus Cloacimonetes bacterium]|nr:PQQ-dependent sugar dehydrogenase [Candidatus Cloacimonadota bacterium]